jgi:hypothetical protein
LCLRRFRCWLVLLRPVLATGPWLCKAVLALLSLAGPLLSSPSLLPVKRARLLLLLKQARFLLGLAGLGCWLCWLVLHASAWCGRVLAGLLGRRRRRLMRRRCGPANAELYAASF